MTLSYDGPLTLEDVLKHKPEYREFLEELEARNWRFHHAEIRGEAVLAAEFEDTPYRVMPKMGDSAGHGGGGMMTGPHGPVPMGGHTVQIDLPKPGPQVQDVGDLETFTVNISTREHSRAVTVDLTSREIVYIHADLWDMDPEKPDIEDPEAVEDVAGIVTWLLEEQDLALSEDLDSGRFERIRKALRDVK
jgi:hypothetical protein